MIWDEGRTNPSGIGSRVFYIRKRHIKKWPTPPDPAAAQGRAAYTGDFEMAGTNTAIEIYSTQGTGNVESESIGDKDCKGFNNKFKGSYPDLNDDAVAHANSEVNSNGIFVAQHFTAGGKPRWVVIGGQHYDPEVSLKATSGAKIGEKKGLEIEATAGDAFMLPEYAGLIKLAEGTYNCATDVFTEKEEAGG